MLSGEQGDEGVDDVIGATKATEDADGLGAGEGEVLDAAEVAREQGGEAVLTGGVSPSLGDVWGGE